VVYKGSCAVNKDHNAAGGGCLFEVMFAACCLFASAAVGLAQWAAVGLAGLVAVLGSQ
jgi:hypothetical protein